MEPLSLELIEKTGFILLAGGKSRRMGTDKADLTYNGLTFLTIQKEKAVKLGFDEVLISGYHGKDKTISTIPDIYPKRGPLGGLHACLLASKKKACFVISVDVPLIKPEIIKNLVVSHHTQNGSQKKATILCHEGKWEPLIGIYDTDIVPVIEKLLDKPSAAMWQLLKTVGYSTVELKQELNTVRNINTPEDFLTL